uniref:Photosystem I subunit IX n=1 Tax=Cuscuta boldinghii TaxID=437623 RepID=A0A4Y5N1G3_9ASTE|nr:photosystem I subunit IX [Cuscuta boldinghii]QCW07735.1 photosystem I subunit IX [Cuscuta boldinghii]
MQYFKTYLSITPNTKYAFIGGFSWFLYRNESFFSRCFDILILDHFIFRIENFVFQKE